MSEFASQPSFGEAPVGEGLAVKQDARCEQEPMACRECASFVGIEGDLSYGEMVLGAETLQDPFSVIAQVARGLRK